MVGRTYASRTHDENRSDGADTDEAASAGKARALDELAMRVGGGMRICDPVALDDKAVPSL